MHLDGWLLDVCPFLEGRNLVSLTAVFPVFSVVPDT